MANPFVKGWKYLMQSFDTKIDENADPKVQIQQAVAAAKKQHQEITEHAAAIIGNRNQLSMKLDRLLKSQQDLEAKTKTALQTNDDAAAEVIATQLVSVEQELEQTKQAYASAEQAAQEAQAKQKESEARLQEQLAQVSQLESQLDQAKMQEQTTAAMDSMNQFGGNDNVPTLDGVRDKIERRYSQALGEQELAKSSMTDRMTEIESAGSDVAASARLDQIRAELSGGKSASSSSEAPKEIEDNKD
ncbi:PspA/IM30 family protein [Corynebacterium sp. MC-17D]|uniref:PspA/IM30 family protein n=1 Tax=Corynebacterium lipophilum TaxID=2804918 RepID=A0AAW5HUK5_9CORY|nr:PspA/IM30 family protein [Corynebacterium lipophilum]MCO6394567.1 PspA/IM30 family protein [Corynebacterium lipophilum]MCZ2117211.1 PspA/IM30 family protein [Corynebacterium lipophilum]